MNRTLILGAIALSALIAPRASLAEDVLDKMYGEGVHAYFSGDTSAAEESLQSVIDQNLRDPRAHYFLGLCKLRSGDPDTADAHFAAGAKLETKSLGRFYAVSKSLERVQGAARRQIEKHRTAARALALQQRERDKKLRYDELNDAEEDVLMPAPGPSTPAEPDADQSAVAEETPSPAKVSEEPRPAAPATDDPFANES